MKIKPLADLTTEEGCYLVDLIMEFSREYNAPHDARREDIAKLIPKCYGLAGIDDHGLAGAIGGIFYWNVFNASVKMLGELFWFVYPAYRKTTLGGRLLRRFEEMGEEEGASVVMATLDSTPASVGKYLEKRNFVRKETSWVRWQSPPLQQ